MKREVSIMLRVDCNVGNLLLEIEGEVEREEDVVTLLGFMDSLVKKAAIYGGTWTKSTKLREFNPLHAHHTFIFPNYLAKDQFYNELMKEGKKIAP